MPNTFLTKLLPTIATSLLAASNSAYALTFSDTEFATTSYDIQTLHNNGGSIAVTQAQTGGNPGAHLNITTSAPASPSTVWVNRTYLINKSFVYDTSISGSIKSLAVQVDVSATMPQPPFSFLSNGTRFVIEQAGSIYGFGLSLPTIQNTYQTAAANELFEADFSLVIDPIVGTYDTSKHPNFNAGILRFGIAPATFVSNTSTPYTLTYNFDNLQFAISAVPEASVLMQMTLSFPVLFLLLRRRRRN